MSMGIHSWAMEEVLVIVTQTWGWPRPVLQIRNQLCPTARYPWLGGGRKLPEAREVDGISHDYL